MQLVVLISLLVYTSASVSIGDRLVRGATEYVPMPANVAEATAQGWKTNGVCVPGLGVAYSFEFDAPTQTRPWTIYMSANRGTAVGVGMEVYGQVESKLLELGYYIPVSDNHYKITATFAEVGPACITNPITGPESLGDRLIINAKTIAASIPVTEAEAEAQNWFKGACFSGMGTHWLYDLETAPTMSWKASNLLPVVPMYDQGLLNAFFFATTQIQQGLLDSHWWDRVPITDAVMCSNTCDPLCHFDGTLDWSVVHVYFRDHDLVKCPNLCTVHCCPPS